MSRMSVDNRHVVRMTQVPAKVRVKVRVLPPQVVPQIVQSIILLGVCISPQKPGKMFR